MQIIIGTDEAGYGPNLGPLVIASTKWKVPNDIIDLRSSLKDSVCQVAVDAEDSRIEVGDSKQLYSSGQSLARLERGVLAFASLTSDSCESFSDFLDLCGCASHKIAPSEFFTIANQPCPSDVSLDQLRTDYQNLTSSLKNEAIEFCGIQVRCIFPQQFNSLLELRENKATLLSHETLDLIAGQMEPDTNHFITCDKHGGRSKYAGLIQHCLTDSPVQIHRESLERSRYTWHENHLNKLSNSIEFIAKGESQLPIALASMAAKYVRERFMLAWNQFWDSEIPGIKPTAGYPLDAKRFKSEIAGRQSELGISDQQIWRTR